MGHVTGAELAAAVSNAGGIGTIGAIGMSPEGLRAECKKLRGMLEPGDADPFALMSDARVLRARGFTPRFFDCTGDCAQSDRF